MDLKLFNAEENFVVESMSIGDLTLDFVHDKETCENFFNQKTLVNLFDVSRSTVGEHLDNYLKASTDFAGNTGKIKISLKTSNKGRKTVFYGFDAVTYLAYRINSEKAIQVRNTVSSILNKMFNVAVGKDSINSNKDWLKQQCEVKALQATNAKSASKLLYDVGLKEEADKIYHTHKKLDAEALKYKEMFIDYERLDKEVATVRCDRTEQLKLM